MNAITPDGAALTAVSKFKIPFKASFSPAGKPLGTWDGYEMLDVNELITKGKDGIVAYKVTGDSTLEEIRRDYLIFVDTASRPKNGDIVAASVNGIINVKRFKKEPDGLFLVSAKHPRQIANKDAFQILGVVVNFLGFF